ncbi:MAG: hypothetical protein D6675_00755 [Gemmatimonadetes bacterium]|nr:MAG: hypothetical protein D6675_00755 [Gemmatimonadota bacterium]
MPAEKDTLTNRVSTTVKASTVADFIATGDAAYAAFDNEKALEAYQAGLEAFPGTFDLLWRISRAHIDIGEHLENKDDQLSHYETALDYANQAIEANPESATGYTRRAAATGKISLFKGVFSTIGLVKKVRADCEKALELDPNDSIAHYILARTHHKLTEKPGWIRKPMGLGWGNRKEAGRLFQRAIELRPDFIMYRLDYAHLLIDEKEYEKAREQLRTILELKIQDEDDEARKEEAQQLLKEIEGKK